MKKMRTPLFTLCGILVAATLLYVNHRQSREQKKECAPINLYDTHTITNDALPSNVESEYYEPQTPKTITISPYRSSALSEPAPEVNKDKPSIITSANIPDQEINKADIMLSQEVVDDLKPRTIIITNNITPKMLEYAHWTGKYAPTIFTLIVNDTIIPQSESADIEIDNNELVVSYHFSFMNGYKSGAKKVTFKIGEQTPFVDLAFSWKDEWHILTDQATPESIEDIEFKEQ